MALKSKKRRWKATRKLQPGAGVDNLSGAAHVERAIEDLIPQLIDTAIFVPDEADGREQLKKVVQAGFMVEYGGSIAALEDELNMLTHERQVAEEQLTERRRQLAHTSLRIQTAGPDAEKPFARWRTRHKVETSVVAVLLVGALTASYVTAYSNLVGTGLPVFLETPVAYFMAGMAPLAGLSVKLFSSVFRTDRGYRLFALTLNSIAVVLVLAWTALFALLYHGMSADGIGSGLFDEPTAWDEVKDTLFVALTILCEMALGAVLANRLDRIARIYAPDHLTNNPEIAALNEDIEALKKLVRSLTKEIREVAAKLIVLKSSGELQTGVPLLSMDSRRARIDGSDFI